MADKNKELSPSLQFLAEYDGALATIPTSKIMTMALVVMPTQVNANNSVNPDGSKQAWFQLACNFKNAYGRTTSTGEQVDGNATINTLKIKIQMQHMDKAGVTTDELIIFFNKHYVDQRFVTIPVAMFSPVYENKPCGKKYDSAKGKEVTLFVKTPVPNQFEAVISDYFDLKDFMIKTDAFFNGGESNLFADALSPSSDSKPIAILPPLIHNMTKDDMTDFIDDNNLDIPINQSESKIRKAIIDLLK